MNRIVLITGGVRSGKSIFAEKMLSENAKCAYIATCPVIDNETAERVRIHKERRGSDRWITIEEEIRLSEALLKAASQGAEGVLIDCLSLWVNNLIYHEESEPYETRYMELIAAAKKYSGTVVMVLNEVGLGGVGATPLARRFCDASGRCGQLVAAAADEVYFVVCGLPMRLK